MKKVNNELTQLVVPENTGHSHITCH